MPEDFLFSLDTGVAVLGTTNILASRLRSHQTGQTWTHSSFFFVFHFSISFFFSCCFACMGSDSYWFLSFINGFLYHRLYSHCWKPGMIGKLEDKPQLNSLAFTLTVISNHRLILVLDLTNGSQPAAQLSSHENIQASSRPKRNRGKSIAWCSLTNCSPPLMKVPLQTASSSLTVGNTNGSGKHAPPATTAWSLNSTGQGCQGHQLALKGHTAPLSKKICVLSHTLPRFSLSVLM